jgi:hypothetical protein
MVISIAFLSRALKDTATFNGRYATGFSFDLHQYENRYNSLFAARRSTFFIKHSTFFIKRS